MKGTWVSAFLVFLIIVVSRASAIEFCWAQNDPQNPCFISPAQAKAQCPAVVPTGLPKVYVEEYCALLETFELYSTRFCGSIVYAGYHIPSYLGVIAETESSWMKNPRAWILMGCNVYTAKQSLSYRTNDNQIRCAAATLCNDLKAGKSMKTALEEYTPPEDLISAGKDPGLADYRIRRSELYRRLA